MKTLVAMSSGLGLVAVLAACQAAANLDVTYVDAGVDAATVAPADAGTDVEPPLATEPPLLGEELFGCPCDQAQGLACCVSTAGVPFCTTNQARCDGERGAFYRCFGPDWTTESACCLRVHGATSETGYAASCAAGAATVCSTNEDCPNKDCQIATCQGIAIGTCGAPPPCPR